MPGVTEAPLVAGRKEWRLRKQEKQSSMVFFAQAELAPPRNPKNAVRIVKFKTDDAVIRAVRTWLHEQDKEWYRQGIHTLV
jgi:hypothetical protein